MAGLDRYDETSSLLIYASAVRLGAKGILLLGRSGSGKSDLALQLIDGGGVLVADDQVRLSRVGDRLLADPPAALAGLIEIRGIGIMRLPYRGSSLDLAVDLGEMQARLPEQASANWLGVDLPKIMIDPRAPSAAAKIRLALHAERAA